MFTIYLVTLNLHYITMKHGFHLDHRWISIENYFGPRVEFGIQSLVWRWQLSLIFGWRWQPYWAFNRENQVFIGEIPFLRVQFNWRMQTEAEQMVEAIGQELMAILRGETDETQEEETVH